jgi:hypothetical protein
MIGIVSALAAAFVFAWIWKSGIDSTRETIIGVAEAFRPDEVVETFEVWREMKATGTDGNILEVATAESTETFTRKTNLEMFGKTLPLGTTISEISVPATYRYHIDLDDDWFLTSDGSRLLILAPRVRPSLPIAFDSGGVRKKTKSGWARWDGDDNLELLEQSVTARLAERASSPESIEKIQYAGREAVAKFVNTLLLSHHALDDAKFNEIVVMFEGEKGESLSSMPASLRWEGGEEKPVLP